MIHADLSGLGQAFRAISRAVADRQSLFKAAADIETLVRAAVRAASRQWLLPAAEPHQSGSISVIPARPIVLGGDDITVIMRADVALPFTKTLLAEIERLSADSVAACAIPGLNNRLSACAGIALVKVGQPFLMASALAESLCGFAKRAAKQGPAPYPSFLAFHNAQSTLRESYDDLRLREMTTKVGMLTANPYLLGLADAEATKLEDLVKLVRVLAGAPGRGNLITAGQQMFEEGAAARGGETWERWREVLAAREPKRLIEIDGVLANAGFRLNATEPAGDWPAIAGIVSDALEWIDFGLAEALDKDDARSGATAVAA